MPYFNMHISRKASKGASLVITIFIAIVAALITITMLTLSSKNTDQLVNDKEGKKAHYAAMAGLERVISKYNADYNGTWLKSLADLPFPTVSSPENLNNDTSYWVDSVEYVDSGKAVMVKIIGKSKQATRKIRAKLETDIPKAFGNFGLLTDGLLSISGDKYLKMNTHGNKGLTFSGDHYMYNNSTASQSSNKLAGDPDPSSKPVGGYIPPIKVPDIPVDHLRQYAKTGLILNANDPNLQLKINNSPPDIPIYIQGNVISYLPQNNIILANNRYYHKRAMLIPAYSFQKANIKYIAKPASSKGITFDGNQQGRFIFIEGDAIFNADGFYNLSNMMLVTTGDLTVNGYVDIDTSHAGEVDVTFASVGQITLNGSRNFAALFWTEDTFRQNGSSIAGKVISRGNLTFNGNFTLEPSGKLHDNGLIEKEVSRSSWQQISMDE
ncbi:MAG: hypothetical protein A2287_04615 [Candidatus Melainabacteria bacterium RIFOXYA12_FULL_32_12]|nr:MAG: hypothetical protein A2255_02260 [Candidatus Melainabacteria bacterium RIFOXYA2_FULL_32_9]OGI28403.1 MAG: hypothetical protein A2287_04615 [Candidatus Melainabacteria bacterium RIFOXYA12_FULL_32_12]